MICFGCWPLVAKKKKTCIKGGFHDVHTLFYIVVHSVHARCLIKCLLGIFSLVWTPMSTKLQRVYRRILSFLYNSCAHPLGEKFYLMHICRGRDISQGRCTYQGGEDIVLTRKLCFVCFSLCLFSCFFYGAFSYVCYLCFVVLIILCLCIGHAYILMLLCFIECMFE